MADHTTKDQHDKDSKQHVDESTHRHQAEVSSKGESKKATHSKDEHAKTAASKSGHSKTPRSKSEDKKTSQRKEEAPQMHNLHPTAAKTAAEPVSDYPLSGMLSGGASSPASSDALNK